MGTGGVVDYVIEADRVLREQLGKWCLRTNSEDLHVKPLAVGLPAVCPRVRASRKQHLYRRGTVHRRAIAELAVRIGNPTAVSSVERYGCMTGWAHRECVRSRCAVRAAVERERTNEGKGWLFGSLLDSGARTGAPYALRLSSLREDHMKTLLLAGWGLVWGFTVPVVACSGNTSSSGHAAPVPQSQFTDSIVTAYCGGFQTCCQSKGFPFSASVCDSNLRGQPSGSSFCSAPRMYNAQAAGDCFAQLQATLSNCLNTAVIPVCRTVCVGTLPAGSACTSSEDCATPTGDDVQCVTTSASSATSVCVVTPRGTLGSGCNSTCTTSADGSEICSVMGVAAGSPVTTGNAVCHTSDGLYCSTADYSCQTIAAVGGSCPGYCVSGAYCDMSKSMCMDKVAAGSACPTGNECMDGTYCNSSHVCAAPKATGQPCSLSPYNECVGYCDPTTNICADNSPSGFNPTAASCANPTLN